MVINELIARINRVCRNDKEKDILSLTYIILLVSYFCVIVVPLLIVTLEPFIKYGIYQTPSVYHYIMNGGNIPQKIINITFDIKEFIWILKISLIGLIPVISRIIFKKAKFQSEFIVMVLSISGLVFVSRDYLGWSIIFLVFLLIVYIIPLGERKYFNLINNAKYLEEIRKNYLHKNQEFSNRKFYEKLVGKFLVIAVLIFLIAALLSYYMKISFIFMIIIISSLTCILYLYKETKDKILTVFKKVIIFVIFVVISLYANRIVPSELDKILLLVITVYFSFDRVVSLGKDIQDIIKKYSLRYYYEDEFLSVKDIKDEYLEMKFINSFEIDEHELIKQIILRDKVCFLDELNQLCELYTRKKFEEYRQLVEFYLYIININSKEEINLNDEERNLKNILKIQNQKLFPIELYKEYATILYTQKKFDEAIEFYEEFLWYLNKDELNNMYQCYKELGKDKEAGKLKQHYINTM
ncbi:MULTISPECIES: hypothetical protein [Streptococcus]|nr:MULTISPECIES: hypothetical protein [Streptococcus]OXT14239.1 hypothetical protein CBI42_02090 [Streptococcus sp. KR]